MPLLTAPRCAICSARRCHPSTIPLLLGDAILLPSLCCSAQALGIAGGIIEVLADTWQAELLDVLGDDLGGDTSIEERVVQASLRSMPPASRAGVESLFACFSIFAEDAVVPAVVVDIIAPLMEGYPEDERKRKLLVRQWLKLLLKGSLVQGSIEHGVYVHDLIRDCMLRRAEARA